MQFSRQLPHRDTVAALSRLPIVSRLDLLFRLNASRRFALLQGVQQRSLPFPVHNVRHTTRRPTRPCLPIQYRYRPACHRACSHQRRLTSPHVLNSARQRMEIGIRSWDFSPGNGRISRATSALSSRSGASVRLPKARTRRSSWVASSRSTRRVQPRELCARRASGSSGDVSVLRDYCTLWDSRVRGMPWSS